MCNRTKCQWCVGDDVDPPNMVAFHSCFLCYLCTHKCVSFISMRCNHAQSSYKIKHTHTHNVCIRLNNIAFATYIVQTLFVLK